MSTVAQMKTVERGYLLLADLTGYTAYLAGSEIEHAPVIAGDLLDTVIGRLEPPFRLAKLEGDAAFCFVEEGRAEPALLVDAIEAAYFAFRRRLRSIEGATTCDCRSCGLAPRLNLKLFLHHGSYVHTSVAGRDELAGADVILAHRLLKGAVARGRRATGFALLTADALEALGVEPGAMVLTEASEMLAHIGQVKVFVLDLESRWQSEGARRRLSLAGMRPVLELHAEVGVDPATAWAHLTSPALRGTWEGPIRFEESTASGRRGVGTTTRCVTGRLATIEEIVDWQPHDYVGWRVARPGLGQLEAIADLEPANNGTKLRLRWCVPEGSAAAPAAIEQLRKEKTAAVDRLASRLSGLDRLPPRAQEVPA